MQSLLLPIHLCAIGIWLGCVVTEALFERALLGKGHEQELILAALHKRVDLIVEVPAFMLVIITGGLMLPSVDTNLALQVKIAVGLVAIIANAYCVLLVFKRFNQAASGDWLAFAHTDRMQHKIGAVVLLSILIALGLGPYRNANA